MTKAERAELQSRYELIVLALIANGSRAYMDELVKKTRLNTSQIAKALQYGRRNFDFEKRSIRDYVMASGDGYFLTDDEDEAIAYAVQVMKDALSRLATSKGIYEHMNEKNPEKMSEAFNMAFEDSDEMEPWAVFNSLKGGFMKGR